MDGLKNEKEGRSFGSQPFYLAFTGPGTVLDHFLSVDLVRMHFFMTKSAPIGPREPDSAPSSENAHAAFFPVCGLTKKKPCSAGVELAGEARDYADERDAVSGAEEREEGRARDDRASVNHDMYCFSLGSS